MGSRLLNSESNKSAVPFKIIIFTCLLVGTLDISAACIDSFIRLGTNPIVVLQFIASGVFGNAAFSGGLLMALAGLFFHYLIASSWTILFFIIYPKLKLSVRFKIISGLLYGILIWLIMNLIIVPLSRTPKLVFHLSHAIMGVLYLMFLIGLPVSLIYNKYSIVEKK